MKNGSNGMPVQILLVEDNPGDAKLTVEAFREGRTNNNLYHVHDGVEALAYLRHEDPYSTSARPDIILLDLNMPRKNGMEVLEELKADRELKSIPVIVLTTSDGERDIEQSYALQASCYINKPVDLGEFFEVARKIEDFWFTIVKLPKGPIAVSGL